jgi:site-specific DNA-methyltransferase (adenine-specific)
MRITLPQGVTLYHADCREALRSLPSDSIDSVPCDPPYELNFMGKGWDDTGIANDPALWAEVFRVLKPGGHLAAFSASRTYHRMACAIEDAGFEIRDSLMWIYGVGFPKSLNVSKAIDKAAGATRTEIVGTKLGRPGMSKDGSNQRSGFDDAFGGEASGTMSTDILAPATPEAAEWEGWGTALKPAFEPIVLARKPLSEPTVAANVLKWRTGALNIGACRVGYESDADFEKAKGGDSASNKGGEFLGAKGAMKQSEKIDRSGRWPANLVHDGSDEVVGMFPNTGPSKAAKTTTLLQRQDNKGLGSITPGNTHSDAGGSAARFFYSAKASRADRNGSKHPTVKPIALMEWLAKLITPPGGTILDPFAGSGTTGIAATRCGFKAILCEREAEYVADIRARFAPQPRPSLRIHPDHLRQEAHAFQAIRDLRTRWAAAGVAGGVRA